jgi:hypothetical protein
MAAVFHARTTQLELLMLAAEERAEAAESRAAELEMASPIIASQQSASQQLASPLRC